VKTATREPYRAALLIVALVCGAPEASPAFHEGGVANCDGCHVMHGTEDGFPLLSGATSEWSLREASPSDVCLVCHADSFGAVLGSNPLAPPPELGGGNFVFLLEDNLNDSVDGQLNPIPGDAAGHNIVAPAHNLTADSRYTEAPGGTFLTSEMGCTACHDPHGNGNFRMLYGEQIVFGGLYAFAAPPPDAEGIDLHSGGAESEGNHTAYRAGMSDWCGNCHGRYHDQSFSGFEHKSDESLETEHISQYNSYNGDADPAGGLPSSAYLPEVPFEDEAVTIDSRSGPSNTSSVMCLSCHRAHASSAPSSLRWDPNVSLLEQDGTVSGSYPIPDPYDSPAQGTLCTKCHQGGPPSLDPFDAGDSFLDALFGR